MPIFLQRSVDPENIETLKSVFYRKRVYGQNIKRRLTYHFHLRNESNFLLMTTFICVILSQLTVNSANERIIIINGDMLRRLY